MITKRRQEQHAEDLLGRRRAAERACKVLSSFLVIALPLALPYDVTYSAESWTSSCRSPRAVAAAERYRVRGGETVRRTVRRRPTSNGVPQRESPAYQFLRPCATTKRYRNKL